MKPVVLSALLTIGVLVIAACALLTNRRLGVALVLVGSAQLLRLFPAIEAQRVWPGGDDGPLMGWGLFVIPLMLSIAAVGAVGCILYLSKVGLSGKKDNLNLPGA